MVKINKFWMVYYSLCSPYTEHISHALQKLTDPGRVHLPGISSVVDRARTRMRTRKPDPVEDPPIPVSLLNDMLFVSHLMNGYCTG